MYTYNAKVVRVVDGDTLVVDVDMGFQMWHHNCVLRLDRVDAWEKRGPERPQGLLATERVEELVAFSNNSVVITTTKKGSFGRWLAEVVLEDGGNLGDILLKEGHAEIYKP